MTERAERNRDLVAVAGLALLITILFADVLFLGNTLYFRDIAREYYPTRRIFHDLVRGGEIPLWNPRYGAGQPFAANPGYQAFYPVGWLTLLIPNFDLGFRLEVLFHFYLAAIAMFAFLRSCSASRPGALLGATAWSIGGMLVSLSNLLPFLFSAAWLPLLALLVRRFLREKRLRDFALAALTLGVILLAGDQSMILQAGFLAGCYAIYHSVRSRQPLSRAIGFIVLICVAALASGAAQILPAFDFQRDSGRAVPLQREVVMQWSMAPLRPLELAFPNVFGHFTSDAPFFWAMSMTKPFPTPFVLNIYPGLLIAGLFIAGLMGRTRGWTFAAVVVPMSYVMAIGRFGPIFPLLYTAGFRGVRYPEKFWISGMFVLTAFAAMAFDERERIWRQLRMVLAVVAASAVAVAAVAFTPLYARLFDAAWRLPGPAAAMHASQVTWPFAAAIAVGWLVIVGLRTRLPERTWLILCGAMVIVDLAPHTPGLMPRISPDFATPPPAIAQLGRPPSEARILNEADWTYLFSGAPRVPYSVSPWLVRNSLSPRSFASWGTNGVLELDITGTDLLPTREFTGVFWAVTRARPDRLPLLRAMTGATHSIEPLPMSQWRGADVEDVAPVAVRPLPDGERFYFAEEVVPIRGGSEFVQRMLGPAAYPARTAFVEASWPHDAPARGHLLGSSARANGMTFEVEAAGNALLVVAVTPHRYWRAAIDGLPVPLIRTNIAYQSVVVPSGRHRIEMAYRNPVVTISLAISIIATIALAVTAFADRLRK